MGPEKAQHDWLRLLQENDNEAFVAVYRQYHQAVYANIRRLVADAPVAEDILQDVFLTLWEKRHNIPAEHSIGGWLFTTSFYKSSAWLRRSIKEKLSPLYDSLHETPDPVAPSGDYEEKLAAIHCAIDLLPPRKKVAFRLCRLEGKSYEEAATELGLSTESVKDYVKTASRFIKDHILAHHPALFCVCVTEIVMYLH